MPPTTGGGGDAEINWHWIVRQLRGEPYRMSKSEILDLTIPELNTLMMREEFVSRSFKDDVDAHQFQQAAQERDALLLNRLMEG